MSQPFDPENVKSVDPWSYWVNAGDMVQKSDYDLLLYLYKSVLADLRELQPKQITIEEVYGSQEIK